MIERPKAAEEQYLWFCRVMETVLAPEGPEDTDPAILAIRDILSTTRIDSADVYMISDAALRSDQEHSVEMSDIALDAAWMHQRGVILAQSEGVSMMSSDEEGVKTYTVCSLNRVNGIDLLETMTISLQLDSARSMIRGHLPGGDILYSVMGIHNRRVERLDDETVNQYSLQFVDDMRRVFLIYSTPGAQQPFVTTLIDHQPRREPGT
jgi:hypothetical protein